MRNPRPLLAVTTTLALLSGAAFPTLAGAGTLSASGGDSIQLLAAAHALVDARVIVKYKPEANALRTRAYAASSVNAVQATQLGRRHGVSLAHAGVVADRLHVVTAAGLTADALAEQLKNDAEVEYAVPDRVRRAHAAPNDPRYADGLGGGGPVTGQWYLRAPTGAVQAAIDAESSWSVTQGSPSVVVAVLDTGVRFDHADLLPVSSGGNLLPGYDMISDVTVANDGDGRDADASDPGDGLRASDVAPGAPFADCEGGEQFSSWHGTQTSALVAALTNNGVGMASVGRNVRVLPVRVLGKCGGRDSDIIAGMRWAAGLPVSGVATVNPTPARVINLSLGAEGSCSQAYIDAVNAVTQAGSLVVVSAGNTVGHAVSSPANCPGVLAVAGLQHTGAKVGFSDVGPEVAISAPAGNCVNDPSLGCKYPILTATNSGDYAPVTGSSVYTDSVNYSVGTSFAAPLVSGTAALMLSVRPQLTPLELRLLLQGTARGFPTTGAVVASGEPPARQCTSVQYDSTGSPLAQLQCYCTTGTCGAGMLDTGSAVRAAAQASPDFRAQGRIDLVPSQPVAGTALQLSAAHSVVASGRSITNYHWTLLDGGGIVDHIDQPNSREASVTPSAAGQFTVSLSIDDNASSASTVELRVAVADAPPQTPAAPTGGGGGGAAGALWCAGLLCGLTALAALRRRAG